MGNLCHLHGSDAMPPLTQTQKVILLQARDGACDLLGLNFEYSKTWKTGVKSWKSGVSSCSKFRKFRIQSFVIEVKEFLTYRLQRGSVVKANYKTITTRHCQNKALSDGAEGTVQELHREDVQGLLSRVCTLQLL